MNKLTYFLIALTLSVSILACKPQESAASSWQDEHIESSLVLPQRKEWKGDFDEMKTSRVIRILVPDSKTFYYLDGPKEDGISYKTATAFEKWLNQKYKTKNAKIHVVMIPTTRDKLLTSLNQGLGDIAVGGITITSERQKDYDFSMPLATGINEILVVAKGHKEYTSLDDLAGREISVREDSSYAHHIKEINKTYFKAKGLRPIKIVPVDGHFEDDDILQMVNAGLIDATIVDGYMAAIWSSALPNLKIYPEIRVHSGGELAWAFRKGSPRLAAEINEFVEGHKQGTMFGNILIKKYVNNAKPLHNSSAKSELKKFDEVVGIFEQYGKEYRFDALMLLAQGYQESRLDQSARSHRGAVGIMQLLPSTASDRAVNIKDIDKNAENNIHAGVKYMRHLSDVYVNDEGLDEQNKILMTFAAYNAGPGNLRKFRKLAQQSGLDPNKWFNNVEIAASRIVGQETVQYVENIYKYYVAYRLLGEKKEAEGNEAR